jgi:hypothetical protein
LGGIWTERDLDHEMQLMVMHSNANLCWRDLSQPDLGMPDAIEGQGVLKWLGGAHHVRQAFEGDRMLA